MELKDVMDPGAVLGVSLTATEEDIRAAYLLKVKEYPPDRSPEQFERIRDAYETLRDARRRAHHLLFSVDPGAPLSSLLADHPASRQFVGPQAWLEVLKGK
jgi:curved DNA-binding protein CbpA